MSAPIVRIVIGHGHTIEVRPDDARQINMFDLIAAASPDDLFDLVIAIDAQVDDRNFTLRLASRLADSFGSPRAGDKPSELDLRDERILAEIIAWAETHEKALCLQASGFTNWFKQDLRVSDDIVIDGPCCAIGAGLLFRGVTNSPPNAVPTEAFAALYGVSDDYAIAVSNAFEEGTGCSFAASDYDSDDYIRGYSVGLAARAYAESEGRR